MMFSERYSDPFAAHGQVGGEEAFLQALDILCIDESMGASDAFDAYFKGFKSHYSGSSGDIDIDRDVFEYICDAIASEDARSQTAVAAILAPFYPDLTLRPSDVPGLVRAAEVLKISKEKGNIPLYTCEGPKRPRGLAALRASSTSDATSTDATTTTAAAAAAAAAVAMRGQKSGGSDSETEEEDNEGEDDDDDNQSAVKCLSEAAVMDLSEISSMFPNVPQDVVEHVFIHYCALNKEPTVLFLLDNCGTDADIEKVRCKIEAARLKELREEEQRALQLRAAQAAVVDRFGDQVVRPKADDSGKRGRKGRGDGAIAAALQKQGDAKIRYRDGQVVSHKGEKVIVIKNPSDDYDGGSRGVVKMNGKRGPGWVKC